MITDTLMVDTVLAVIQQAPIESVPLSNIIPEKAAFTFDLVRLLRGMMGMAVLIAIAYLFSNNRKAVNWKMVGTGLLFQVILAIGILYIPFVQVFFEFIGKGFVKILAFTGEGVNYLLKRNDTGATDPALQNFAFSILPTIIFFAAFSSLLFYLGVIQIFVKGFGYVLSRALGLSGPESLSVAGNIFLGQTESPLLIKPYLEKMNKSEILLVMSGGMATLAGGVLAAYIGFLGGGDPVQQVIFAKHLLTASIMAAPGVVVISKIIVPQTEQIDKTIEVSKEEVGKNALDAISNGTGDGLRLAVNVGAMLLVFIAFIAFANYIFVKIGDWTSLNDRILSFTNGKYDELSLEFILGYAFSPLMWLIGVAKEDITLVGSLLGKKLILTEFVAYIDLADMKAAGSFTDAKSIIMSVYMLCGFANFASIGIQIGGIGALAPGRRVLLAQFGMRALLAGTLASLLSATIIGVLMG
jgi:CNT family concentrative nucleoside transporter